MNQQKLYFDTAKAWAKLSNRLRAEGLVEQPLIYTNRFLQPLVLKWVASIVVVVTSVAMVFMIGGKKQLDLITVSNAVVNQTLVKTLDDGSTVYLASNSEIVYKQGFATNHRTLSLQGEAFFEVAKGQNLPFLVEIDNAVVEVVGTSFGLKNIVGQDVELAVETGAVNFTPLMDTAKHTTVSSGELLVFDGVKYRKSVSSARANLRHQRLHFSNEFLQNIIGVINNSFGVNVMLQQESLARRQLSVTFHDNSIEEVLEIICAYYTLSAENTEGGTIVLSMK